MTEAPRDAQARGAQLSIRVRGGADRSRRIFDALAARGVSVQSDEVEGATDTAILSFANIWTWMAT